MADSSRDIPTWLAQSEQYRPGSDRDGFITRSLLAVSSVLAYFRLDDGRAAAFSPSAPVKLVFCLGCIVLVSLARNYLFVLVVLAGLLVRTALLPRSALVRLVSSSLAAAGLTLLVMLPAVLVGQPRAALTLATKSFVCTGITLAMALTTPVAELTGALRRLGLPDVAILSLDLTLRSIVRLGETASEALSALELRSVGRNRRKRDAIGGIGGIVLLKAARAAEQTHDAMRCRGFDGSYHAGGKPVLTVRDPLWLAGLLTLFALFLYLQGMVS